MKAKFLHIRDNFSKAFFPRLSEWTAAFALFAIGWTLSANPELMATTKTQAYSLMLMIAPQDKWASALIAFATLRLLVLLINGSIRRSPHLRAVLAFFSCFPLALISLSFVSTFGIGMALAWTVLGMDMINILRAAGDAKTADYMIAQGKQGGSQ